MFFARRGCRGVLVVLFIDLLVFIIVPLSVTMFFEFDREYR